jgi:hypothetical protein
MAERIEQIDSPEEYFGTKVTVDRRPSDEAIEGWLFADSPLGVFLALDPRGEDVRWFRPGTWWGISYHHEQERASFAPPNQRERSQELRALADAFRRPVETALDRIDFNRVKYVNKRLTNASHDIYDIRREYWRSPELFLLIRDSYTELSDEAMRSGLAETIAEYWPRLRPYVTPGFLPIVDVLPRWFYDLRTVVAEARDEEIDLEPSFGRSYLEYLTYSTVVSVSEKALGRTGDDSPNPGRGYRYRWAAGWLRVASGGIIISGNVGLWIAAMLPGSAVTLSFADAPHLVPLVASVTAGEALGVKGLKELADVASTIDRET